MFLAGSCGYKLFYKPMQSKSSSKSLLFVSNIILIIFTVAVLFLAPVAQGRSFYAKLVSPNKVQPSQNAPDNKTVVPVTNIEQVSFGLPIRLKIPNINVDATIEYVGLEANGEMDVPKDPAAVGWLQSDNRPGDIGSAVIAGHYGVLENGKELVFDNLKKLGKGDKIYVQDEKGATITFVVRENSIYDADADASGVFNSNDGKSHLNLITCQSWDKVSKNYTKRLVVFADKG